MLQLGRVNAKMKVPTASSIVDYVWIKVLLSQGICSEI